MQHRLCPFRNSHDHLKHTNAYSGCRGLPLYFPFRSKLLSQILVKEEPLETLPHSETIKAPKLALQQSSPGVRISWLFMDDKDQGHSKNPGQMHRHGAGVNRHGERPHRVQADSSLLLPRRAPHQVPTRPKVVSVLAPLRTPVCWGFMVSGATWGNAGKGIPFIITWSR